ncbi:MAG TPA: phospho-N-acetylmuramoyl-pentapeptide-transferase [Patescibacteria group bacterium]|nr:phospho-N-acetylmuramoyl-pentapeptide-transferase [Patescibacteria group bacterium]
MELTATIIKIFSLAAMSFILAILLTPLWTDFLYKHKIGKTIRTGKTPVFTGLHAHKAGTPTMGGVLIWFTTLALAGGFWFLDRVAHIDYFHYLNFLTRAQTLLPLGVLLLTALMGLLDDYLGIKSFRGLRMRYRLMFYSIIALLGAYWFYYKLGFDVFRIPGMGNYNLGLWYIPFFIFVVIATSFSVNETDGLDGLAGGVLAVCFFAYGVIAFFQGRYELTAMTGVLGGSLLAFLWFNIYPARFFMGDTGAMSLGTVLAVIAFYTNSVFVLPIIGFILVLESGSVIVQISSRIIFHRKIFLSTPIHHHLEALGWPETKVTMRFWIISAMAAVVGVAINLIGR